MPPRAASRHQVPGQTPEALLRAIDLTVGRRVHGLLPGDFRAHGRGTGTELAAVRPYQAGDDIRLIDWNATARTTVAHVRDRVPERGMVTWLLLDHSASMTFGTAERRKADVAEGVALAVAHVATRRANRLAVTIYGGARDVRMSPRGGRAGLLLALRAARLESSDALDVGAAHERETAPSSTGDALVSLAGSRMRGGLVVLVSDFRGPRDWLPSLAALARRHDVLAVEVRDPREDELVDVGELTLIDGETGREVRVNTSSTQAAPHVRRRCRQRAGLAGRRAAARPGASHRSVHRRRLAALARRPTAPRGGNLMTFASPELLIALVLVPMAIVAYLLIQRRRSRYAVRFTNVDLLANVAPRTPGWRRHLPPLLYLAALAALAVSLARPAMVVAVPREQATVVLTIDVSRSMRATDVSPTRLDAAVAAASTFVDQMPPKFKVGLVAFSTGARLVVAPTTDHTKVKTALTNLRADGGTALGDAIALSVETGLGATETSTANRNAGAVTGRQPPIQAPAPTRLRRQDQTPTVATVLLSDGANSTGELTPEQAAQQAADAGVPIYTIALGTARRHGRGAQRLRLPRDGQRAARSRDAGDGRRDDRRPLLRGTDGRRPGADLPVARLEGRLRAGAAGRDVPVRRNWPLLRGCRRWPGGALVQPLPVSGVRA